MPAADLEKLGVWQWIKENILSMRQASRQDWCSGRWLCKDRMAIDRCGCLPKPLGNPRARLAALSPRPQSLPHSFDLLQFPRLYHCLSSRERCPPKDRTISGYVSSSHALLPQGHDLWWHQCRARLCRKCSWSCGCGIISLQHLFRNKPLLIRFPPRRTTINPQNPVAPGI